MDEVATNAVARIIQLAVAPVFLIAGVGALLNVLAARLGRAVDRSRILVAMLSGEGGEAPAPGRRGEVVAELRAVDRRIARINVALSLATVAALLVCLVIVSLFAGELFGANLYYLIAALFIATMAALIGALIFFLGEITIATRMLRVRRELLER